MAETKTIIGKDVIESLTLGMYEDARFIFREYIQNSADQIDKAVELGLLNALSDGKIEITIDRAGKSITVLDNATGIETDKVASTLKDIAQSKKDRSKNKGFRGIGRLGGLAYCNQLIFETSFSGEAVKSTLTWDAQKLKAIINNRATKEEATQVIDEVTEFSIEDEAVESHYFKVSLQGISNENLLNKDAIYRYLSMVSPVTYNKGFIYKSEIYNKAKTLQYIIDEYPIFLNNNQVFKSYTTSIYQGEVSNKKKFDEIYDVAFFEIAHKNKLLAWAWYSVSKFEKMMPAVNIARGIRLRKGNIQIGLADALVKLFKEPRGTNYFFGEVHIVSAELIPNARRDYFLENDTLHHFERLMKQQFEALHKLYYFSSKVRNEQKKIDDFVSFSKEFKKKTEVGGFTDNKEIRQYEQKFEQKKEKAERAKVELSKAKEKAVETSAAQQKVLEKVVTQQAPKIEKITIPKENGKPKFITDKLSSLTRKDKKLVSRIFGVIDNVLPKDLANILKEKIKEELE